MPNEKFECLCGNDKFRIYAGSLICSSCTLEFCYHRGRLVLPRDFNRQKRSWLSPECIRQIKDEKGK